MNSNSVAPGMNKNRFKTDGFSNPDTQNLFESWSEQLCEEIWTRRSSAASAVDRGL
jgi:hypothetical protein